MTRGGLENARRDLRGAPLFKKEALESAEIESILERASSQ